MSQPLLPRRGTTIDHSGVAGPLGEVSVDTTKKTVVVHDGVTLGGFPLLRADETPAGGVVGVGILRIVRLTQAEYDALPEPDFDTLYVIAPAATGMTRGDYVLTGNPVNLIYLP